MEAREERPVAGQLEGAGSFLCCWCCNGIEWSCLLQPGGVVPHQSAHQSGMVIKVYHQPLPFLSFPSLHFLLPSSRLLSPSSLLSGETTCFGEARIKRHDGQRRREENQINAAGMRMGLGGRDGSSGSNSKGWT